MKSELRSALTEHVAALGPGGLAEGRHRRPRGARHPRASTRSTATSPGTCPSSSSRSSCPLAVLVAVLSQDWISAAIIAVTVPLIPLFMVLIGMATRQPHQPPAAGAAAPRRPLPRRRRGPHDAEGVRSLQGPGADDPRGHRPPTAARPWPRCGWPSCRRSCSSCSPASPWPWSRCRSGCACSTATSTCARRCSCSSWRPEAYLPLRQVGANFHASADGLSAAEQVFSVLDEPAAARGARGPTCPTRRATGWRCATWA